MAKKKATAVLRLVSQAGTGFFYTLRKNVRSNSEKCGAPREPHERPGPLRARKPPPLVPSPASKLPPTCTVRRLQLIKFDPRVNARVLFKEEKIKK